MGELEAALGRLDERPALFEPDEIARAGAFVSLDATGRPKVERGFVRPEDEMPVEPEPDTAMADVKAQHGDESTSDALPSPAAATPAAEVDEDEDPSGRVSDRLLTELTAHRTLSLRAALANDPDAAFLAVLHALALRTFYGSYTCLDVEARSVPLGSHAPGFDDSSAGRTLTKLHEEWSRQMPSQATGVWAFMLDLDHDSRAALLAFCVSRSVKAVALPYDRRPETRLRIRQSGREIEFRSLAPAFQDLNVDLQRLGPETLRRRVARQLAPEDRGRFVPEAGELEMRVA